MTIILPQNILIDYLKQTPINSAHPFETFETLLDNLLNHYISPKDKLLLELAFKKDLTQAELDDFLANWDIEKHGSDTALILAHIMKNHPHLQFNSYTAPRLTGVKNYYRFQNLRLLAQYQNIVKILNKHNIFPLIIKGGAMKHLRPDLPRIMNDIDIIFHTKQEYNLALKTVKDLGYKLVKAEHSVDIHNQETNESILDLHWCMDASIKAPLKLNQLFFSRATKETVFNTTSYLPKPKIQHSSFCLIWQKISNKPQISAV